MAETKDEWIERMVDALGVDPEDIMEVTEMFFDDVFDDIATMRSSFESGDIETLARLAHGLKGSSSNIGLESVSEVAKILEIQAKDGVIVDLETQLTVLTATLIDRKAFVGL